MLQFIPTPRQAAVRLLQCGGRSVCSTWCLGSVAVDTLMSPGCSPMWFHSLVPQKCSSQPHPVSLMALQSASEASSQLLDTSCSLSCRTGRATSACMRHHMSLGVIHPRCVTHEVSLSGDWRCPLPVVQSMCATRSSSEDFPGLDALHLVSPHCGRN